MLELLLELLNLGLGLADRLLRVPLVRLVVLGLVDFGDLGSRLFDGPLDPDLPLYPLDLLHDLFGLCVGGREWGDERAGRVERECAVRLVTTGAVRLATMGGHDPRAKSKSHLCSCVP